MFNIPTVDLIATGKNIEKLRKDAGYSVKELQEIFGFGTPQAIYKWQHGTALPTVDNLVLLSAVFNVSIDEILVVEQGISISAWKEKADEYDKWTLDDYILGEPDYDAIYFEDKIIVTGHTPTGLIERSFNGKIWQMNNHIAIDCGAVFGNSLGCLRLDDMKEFYV